MKKDSSFFVGWQSTIPSEQKKLLKKIVIGIFIFIPIVAFIIVTNQRPFNQHQFQFGNLSEITGIYHAHPVPILEVTDGSLPEGVSKYILLVGFGKFGAEGIIAAIEKDYGPLDFHKVVLQGTLIYGDGKAVLELTKKEKSLVTKFPETAPPSTELVSFNDLIITGEILDPKCYFGVMKPGEGKIHKSCAIRCISGGIPPVFRNQEATGNMKYSIVLGADGQKINQQILEYIGEQIELEGRWGEQSGWGVVYLNSTSLR